MIGVKYLFNHGSRILHTATCSFATDVYHKEESYLVEELLEHCDKSVKCCKRCLKNDENAHKLVEAHNSKL